jgi:hypothetical protein
MKLNPIEKAAREFKSGMQDIVDKADGFSSISISVDGGKNYIPIAEKQPDSPIKTNLMSTKKETLNLKCTLTDEEIMDLSKEQSEYIQNRQRSKDELKSFSSQKKAEIDGFDANINRTAQLISTGAEYRNILCEVIVDEAKNEVYWIRQDTNEIVNRESPIPVRYSQPEIPLGDNE